MPSARIDSDREPEGDSDPGSSPARQRATRKGAGKDRRLGPGAGNRPDCGFRELSTTCRIVLGRPSYSESFRVVPGAGNPEPDRGRGAFSQGPARPSEDDSDGDSDGKSDSDSDGCSGVWCLRGRLLKKYGRHCERVECSDNDAENDSENDSDTEPRSMLAWAGVCLFQMLWTRQARASLQHHDACLDELILIVISTCFLSSSFRVCCSCCSGPVIAFSQSCFSL